MSQVPQELDSILKDARRVQELAKELEAARSASEARRIRRKMAEVSKDIEQASRALRDHDEAMRAIG